VGFSFIFTSLLLKKLKKLEKERRIFEDELEELKSRQNEQFHCRVNPIAVSIMEYISEQTKCEGPGGATSSREQVKKLMEHAGEFLDIFR